MAVGKKRPPLVETLAVWISTCQRAGVCLSRKQRSRRRCQSGVVVRTPQKRGLCGFFFAGAVGYLWRLAGQRGPEIGVEIGQGMTAPELYDSRWKLFAAGQPAF